jgi:hypothetical protein
LFLFLFFVFYTLKSADATVFVSEKYAKKRGF